MITFESFLILCAMLYAGGIVYSLSIQHDGVNLVRTLTEAWLVMMGAVGTLGIIYMLFVGIIAVMS